LTVSELRSILTDDVLQAAESLVGAELLRGGLRAQIVETEAYRGEDDPACHAFRGPTPRNQIMFGEPGIAYVYFNYGVHWMLNVCCHEPGRAAAILIRAAEPLQGLEEMRGRRDRTRVEELLSGPGKLACAFGITGQDNGLNLLDESSPLRLIPRIAVPRVLSAPRIGIAQGKRHDLPWRFLDAERLKWASRPRPSS
jgi:DNA-3-methyladenine glycosylase